MIDPMKARCLSFQSVMSNKVFVDSESFYNISRGNIEACVRNIENLALTWPAD